MTARAAAAGVLLAVDRGRTTLAAAIDDARRAFDDPRDRALLQELSTGSLRWRAELDALIEAASRRAIGTIDPQSLAILRIGAYQVRHLDRVPMHAIVHESVEAARAIGAARAAGFVNAVLRTMIRRGSTLRLPGRPPVGAKVDEQVRYLSTTLSHPAWLVRRWIARHGFEAAEAWCRFNNDRPALTARPRGARTAGQILAALQDLGIEAAPAPFVPGAIRLGAGTLGSLPEDLRDDLAIHDEGSQLVAAATGAAPGERVLDVCAAPGGKTLVAATGMRLGFPGQMSQLVAADFRRARVDILADAVRAAGLPVGIVRLDGRVALPFQPVFDCVLLDVPCSGLGTLRRDPDLKWTRHEADLAPLAATARTMLARAAEVTRVGGRVVYATCSSEPEENEDVVRDFLREHPAFAPGRVALPSPQAAPLVDEAGYLRTLPFRDGLDAFFAAVLVRQARP